MSLFQIGYRNIFKAINGTTVMPSEFDTGKTTVSFPINLLLALRAYMLQENLSPLKQSEIIADALRDYLRGKGIEIPPNDGKTYRYSVTLEQSDE